MLLVVLSAAPSRPRAIAGLAFRALFASLLCSAAASTASAFAISAFPTPGSGGARVGQTFDFGSDGQIFELDAFVSVGGALATTALSSGSLPAGLSLDFDATLSGDASDLLLTYSFTNTLASAVDDVFFVSFVDAEIAEPVNSFFNEYATTAGSLAPGQGFEVDEPGFAFGDIFQHVQAGALDDTNALPDAANADDVSIAMSWELGSIGAGETRAIEVLLSEDGDSIGTFSVTQRDGGRNASPTRLTMSGRPASPAAPIPEPRGALLFSVGALFVLARTRAARGPALRR